MSMTFQPDVLGIPAGKLFWRFDGPVNPEHGQPHALGSTRPTLLFIHAAVSDHTLWDDQVAFCTSKGWGCLRYDLFGFGQSSLDQTLHTRDRISPVKLHEHTAKVVAAYLDSVSGSGRKDATRFVVIGLSRGGGIAVDFILSHPDKVTGLVICAGALGGLDVPNTSAEESAFNDLETLMNRHEIENATRTLVRMWGDGPLERPGRSDDRVRKRLYAWCKRIVEAEDARTGGDAIPSEDLHGPPAAERLSEIQVKTIVATGK